jgi:hypothetical protein
MFSIHSHVEAFLCCEEFTSILDMEDRIGNGLGQKDGSLSKSRRFFWYGMIRSELKHRSNAMDMVDAKTSGR